MVSVRHNHIRVMRTRWGHMMVKVHCNHNDVMRMDGDKRIMFNVLYNYTL